MSSHAKSFFPEHLTGRGVTLLNLFGMGGAGLFQSLSGRLYAGVSPNVEPVVAYQILFAFFGAAVLVGIIAYAFSRDARNEG